MENTKCVKFKQEAETLFLARGRKQRAKYAVGPLRRRINPCSLHGTLETTPTDDVTVGMFFFRVCLVRPHLLPQRVAQSLAAVDCDPHHNTTVSLNHIRCCN